MSFTGDCGQEQRSTGPKWRNDADPHSSRSSREQRMCWNKQGCLGMLTFNSIHPLFFFSVCSENVICIAKCNQNNIEPNWKLTACDAGAAQ